MDKKVSTDERLGNISSIGEINYGLRNPLKIVKKKLRKRKLMKLQLL